MNHLLGVVAYIMLLLIAVLAMYDLITRPESQQLFKFQIADAVVYLMACFFASLFPCVWWICEHAPTLDELYCFWAFVTMAHLLGTWLLAWLLARLFKKVSGLSYE